MPTEQELLARLAARAEALDLAVARLSQEEINDYVALLEERSRVAEIAADTGTGPIRLVLPPAKPPRRHRTTPTLLENSQTMPTLIASKRRNLNFSRSTSGIAT